MDLDDIEIQSVEVINNPDGTQTCRIGYITKPLAQQDPYRRAQVQFVENRTASKPIRPMNRKPAAQPPIPAQTSSAPPPRPAAPAPPPNPRTNPTVATSIRPLTSPLREAWKHGSVKALVIGFSAALILQIIFLIMRAS